MASCSTQSLRSQVISSFISFTITLFHSLSCFYLLVLSINILGLLNRATCLECPRRRITLCKERNVKKERNACADDLTVASEDPDDGQVMLSESQEFSSRQRFNYQPVKGVCIIDNPINTHSCEQTDFELNGTELAQVNSTTHLGIKSSTTLKKTGDENVQHNITKSRRTAYSLLASGLHGTNG